MSVSAAKKDISSADGTPLFLYSPSIIHLFNSYSLVSIIQFQGMDALLPGSVSALVKATGAILVITAACVASFYWEGVHIGSDGIYLV